MWKIVPPFAMEVTASQSCAVVAVAGRHPAAPLAHRQRARDRRVALQEQHARPHLRTCLGDPSTQIDAVDGREAGVDHRDVRGGPQDRGQRPRAVMLRADDREVVVAAQRAQQHGLSQLIADCEEHGNGGHALQ